MDGMRKTALEYALRLAERERDHLQIVISYLSERLAWGEGVDGDAQEALSATRTNAASIVVAGEFQGMKSTNAAEIVLRRLGPGFAPRTEELLEAIWRGGVRISGRDPAQGLYRSLYRSKKTFAKVGIARWGLTAWDNEAASAPSANDVE